MDYSTEYLMSSDDAAVMAVGLIALVILLVSMAIGLAGYILNSVGLYTIAKRRGISKPWLAWIPVVHVWIIGSISDQFRYVTKGQIKNKRKILGILMPAMLVVSVVLSVLSEMPGADQTLSGVGAIMSTVMVLAVAAAVIVATVTYYMAMFDLYTSVNPAYNVVFLVLSIIFNITEPFFVFFNRKKDLGMPPRGGAAPAPVQEPWVNNPEA